MTTINQRIFLLICFVLLVLNFQFDFMDKLLFRQNYLIFESYQKDSAQIVINCINRILLTGDFISPLINQGGSYYFQQVGLQGKLMGICAYIFSSNASLIVCFFEFLNSVLLSFVLVYFIHWSIREFGVFSGVMLLIIQLFSTWVIFMARNIYWLEWLMFLPIVLGLWYFSNRNKILGARQSKHI